MNYQAEIKGINSLQVKSESAMGMAISFSFKYIEGLGDNFQCLFRLKQTPLSKGLTLRFH